MPVNGIVHLSDAALIAVHALGGLAAAPGRLVQSKDLAAIIDASEHHLSKVMQRLVRAGIVHSVKGPSGGFRLDRPADEISFRDAIEAVDGPLSGEFCPFRTDRCDPDNCIFGHEITKHAVELVAYLSRRTIADIAREAATLEAPAYGAPKRLDSA
ncbi:MAG: Rrf2 family transcriptional regulator [Spirochaetes bacterium]|nr:Rrf2 family transcriptional regulator [Spirochaetota bacterium]MBU1082357.1 Rrf2 family transcriptional regulator [Spirochaetota bacterium]